MAVSLKEATQVVEDLKDDAGQGVDEEIRPLLTALIAAGFKTSASCAGHPDQNDDSYPYILLNHPAPDDEWEEEQRERWCHNNIKQQRALYKKLEAFYREHQAPDLKSMLVIGSIGAGIAELRPYGGPFISFEADFPAVHKRYLDEMHSFAVFLTKKAAG